MIRSMTGYGTAAGTVAGNKITIEIRSLNSKFFELNLRLPPSLRDREADLRMEISKSAERGKIDFSVNFDNSELARKASINKEIFKAYYEELRSIADALDFKEVNWADTILKLPQVLNSDRSESSEEQWNELLLVLREASAKFNKFRCEEGIVLEKDMEERVTCILRLLDEVTPFEKQRVENIRARLHKSLADVRESAGVDENRFEQELIFYIEKLDISEEKTRLRSHCNYFVETMKSTEANGKKLGFIGQEIGREINTLGAKANDASIQRKVVEMKDELEKLKEQLANVL
ncbi:MAG: YicC/YloC family endoribonuclease [Bacteroidota bacterium]